MEDDYCQSGFKTASSGDQVYTYYHQADYLTASLNENGFAIIDLQRKESPAPNGTNSKDLLIIAKRIV
jgi:hypothetical protein